jgi:hypothetical protein
MCDCSISALVRRRNLGPRDRRADARCCCCSASVTTMSEKRRGTPGGLSFGHAAYPVLWKEDRRFFVVRRDSAGRVVQAQRRCEIGRLTEHGGPAGGRSCQPRTPHICSARERIGVDCPFVKIGISARVSASFRSGNARSAQMKGEGALWRSSSSWAGKRLFYTSPASSPAPNDGAKLCVRSATSSHKTPEEVVMAR